MWNFGTYVDGTNNHSKWLTLQRAPQLGSSGFAIETVKEVQLITNQFSAEFGGHSAGVSSMITKSGTNEVTGSAFVMIRPGDWDAAPPLAPIVNGEIKAPYNQQQFGGTVGGPIVNDKAVLLRQLRAAARAQPGGRDLARGERPGGADAGRRAPGPRQARLALLGQELAWASATTWCAGTRTTRAAACNLPGTGFIWDNNVDTVHGTFTTILSDRFLNEVRGQYSRYTDQPRRQVRVRVDRAQPATRPPAATTRARGACCPKTTYDLSDTRLAVVRQPHR